MLTTLSVLFWAAIAPASAAAAELASIQKVFSVKVDMRPNALLPVSAKRIHADIPVQVLTNASGDIEAVQVGDDATRFNYEMKDGSVQRYSLIAAAGPIDLLRKKLFTLLMKAPVVGTYELLHVDGTRIDPRSGGPLVVRYVSSITGSTHDVRLHLRRQGRVWVALSDESLIESTTVTTGLFGMGFSAPRYAKLDPNRIQQLLQPTRITDARISDQQIKRGSQELQGLENAGLKIHPLEFSVRTFPAR